MSDENAISASGKALAGNDAAQVRDTVFPGWDDGAEIKEIKAACDWLVPLVPDDWQLRVGAIKAKIARITSDPKSREAVSFKNDSANWYLYLAETYVERPSEIESHQAARVIPVMAAIGRNVHRLKSMPGAEQRARFLFRASHANADATFFEFLVASGYARLGADVEMLPESKHGKMPDLKIVGPAGSAFVECKRLAPRSQRDLNEGARWREMWRPLLEELVRRRLPVVFDFDFKSDILALPPDYLTKRLTGLLPFLAGPGLILDDEFLSVRVSFVDVETVRRITADERYIKCGSAAERELVGGSYSPTKGWSAGILGQVGYFRGSDTALGNYWNEIDFACGAYWSCSHENSVNAKARDVRSRLAEAVKQIPTAEKGAVHIGLECVDGVAIEQTRMERIDQTMKSFEFGDKNVQVVQCHFLQPDCPPDKNWDFGETIVPFRKHADWSWAAFFAVLPPNQSTTT